MEKSKAFQTSKSYENLAHQTSFTTNAKGTSLDRKHKRRKRPTENNPKQENGNRIIYINNYLKYKWTKCTNTGIIGVPKVEIREKGPEKIFEEIIAENFPDMGKEIVNQVQEAQRVPGRINPRKNTLRHIVIKLTKIKYR